MKTTDINRILLKSKDPSQAILEIYRYLKFQNAKYSIGFLCAASGVSSKGYLADVMKSKRRLNPKYAGGMAKALQLTGASASLFKCLVEFEQEKLPSRRERIERKLSSLKKVLETKEPTDIGLKTDVMFAFELFGRLGLVGNRATRAQILKWYPHEKVRADQTITSLLTEGILQQTDDLISPSSDQIMYRVGSDNGMQIDFIKKMIHRAEKATESWFPNKNESYFESSFISVDSKIYRLLLPKIKELLNQYQSDLEATSADRLIAFNVQIFPADARPY